MRRKAVPRPTEIVTDRAKYIPRCPKCGMEIALQAIVAAFLTPPDWVSFWGRKEDGRWTRCRGESGGHQFIHFRAMLNGRFSERLAWIKPEPTPDETPVQEPLL